MPNKDSVERLAGGIAHDFDQFLTTIIGHAETLGEYLSPGDPRNGDVAAIRHAAERAFGLTQQLLAFSRTRGLRPRVADLNAIIGRSRYTLQRVVGDQIRLEIRLAPDAHRVRVDGEQLQQIVFNLALTARDAMPDGGLLAISTANVSVASDDPRAAEVAPGDYIELSISDSGAPIGPAVQPYLFGECDEAPRRQRGGGLSIALVYDVVEQSGGLISVDSPVDHTSGTRFIVLLPAVEDSATAAVEPRGGKTTGSETVLVAADDPTVQGLIVTVLRRRGYGVLDAPDPWQALRLATGHADSIELLVTTATSNGRVIADGFRATRPDTHVLFVGAPIEEHRDRFANEAVLAQPFTPDALARRVRGLLAAARVHLEMRILPQ
jgi:two-component system, cell cycle sensor histidine kinase and response regulator CckA